MKDKLRELAGDWRASAAARDEIGFYAAADVGRTCAAELLAILDAEGDGGAVPSAYMVSDNGWNQCFTTLDQCRMYGHEIIPLYTHPARSGVVSDEDVNACVDVYEAAYNGNDLDVREKMRDPDTECMRAALEHFAAIAQHQQ